MFLVVAWEGFAHGYSFTFALEVYRFLFFFPFFSLHFSLPHSLSSFLFFSDSEDLYVMFNLAIR